EHSEAHTGCPAVPFGVPRLLKDRRHDAKSGLRSGVLRALMGTPNPSKGDTIPIIR
ncbi:hypothetical protein AVEN_35698-1, partial [Araneus ventricosus]